MFCWAPEGHYYHTLYTSDSALLDLNGTLLNSDNALLARNWRNDNCLGINHQYLKKIVAQQITFINQNKRNLQTLTGCLADWGLLAKPRCRPPRCRSSPWLEPGDWSAATTPGGPGRRGPVHCGIPHQSPMTHIGWQEPVECKIHRDLIIH